jgi:hypothetical protein
MRRSRSNIPPGAAPIIHSFAAPASGQLTLSLSTTSPDFAFLARVYDPSGGLVAGLAGKALGAATLSIGPGSGFYEVSLAGGLDPETQGSVQIALSSSGAVPASCPAPTRASCPRRPRPPSSPPRRQTVCQATSNRQRQRGAAALVTNYPSLARC